MKLNNTLSERKIENYNLHRKKSETYKYLAYLNLE